jgi:hypothetical protein
VEWLAYRCADACVGLLPGIANGSRQRVPAGRRIEMIPNACDLELFRLGKRSDLNLPGVEPRDFVAVFVARMEWRTGLMRRWMPRAQREKLGNCLFFDPMPKRQLAEVLGAADAGLLCWPFTAARRRTSSSTISRLGCPCSTTTPAGWRV